MVRIVELEPDDVLVIGNIEASEPDMEWCEHLREVLGVALIVLIPGPVDLAAVRRHLDETSGGG